MIFAVTRTLYEFHIIQSITKESSNCFFVCRQNH